MLRLKPDSRRAIKVDQRVVPRHSHRPRKGLAATHDGDDETDVVLKHGCEVTPRRLLLKVPVAIAANSALSCRIGFLYCFGSRA